MFDFLKTNNEFLEPVLFGVYVIRDTVANVFGLPIQLENEPLAKRQFSDFLSQMTIYPHRFDFELVHIADYCPSTGTYYPIEVKDRTIISYADISTEVDRLYKDTVTADLDKFGLLPSKTSPGAAVGAEPPQAASSDQ